MSSSWQEWRRRLRFPFYLLIVTALICYFAYLYPPLTDTTVVERIGVTETGLPKEKIIEIRLSRYYADVISLNLNINLQALTFLLCIVLLTSRATETTLPVININIQNRWLHIILPLVLLYFWLNFGYLLDQLIEGRLTLFKIMKQLGSTDGTDLWRLDPLLFDSGWIDAWFSVVYHSESGIKTPESFTEKTFTGILFGLFIGFNHALALCLPMIGYARYGVTVGWKSSYLVVVAMSGFVLVASHLQFAYDGRNPNWIQFSVAGFLVFLSFLIHAIAPFPRFENKSIGSTASKEVDEWVLIVLLDVLFVWERIFTRTRRVRSRQWFERASKEGSPYYSSYREYRAGSISKRQLSDALLHIAVIGDSLTTEFHASPALQALWKARTSGQRNWFLDTGDDETNPIDSVFERIDRSVPLVATQYARLGARVDFGERRSYVDILAKIEHMSGQVDRILRLQRPPDLICVWFGHNSCDWVSNVEDPKLDNRKALARIASQFEGDFGTQIDRLVEALTKLRQRRVILVFGVVNFHSFFIARKLAEEIKASDPNRFPFLERDYEQFESLKPVYRGRVIELAGMLNRVMAIVVSDRQRKISDPEFLELRYSDALSKCDLSSVETLSPVDAWHPSSAGQRRLAESAMPPIRSCLEYLGYDLEA